MRRHACMCARVDMGAACMMSNANANGMPQPCTREPCAAWCAAGAPGCPCNALTLVIDARECTELHACACPCACTDQAKECAQAQARGAGCPCRTPCASSRKRTGPPPPFCRPTSEPHAQSTTPSAAPARPGRPEQQSAHAHEQHTVTRHSDRGAPRECACCQWRWRRSKALCSATTCVRRDQGTCATPRTLGCSFLHTTPASHAMRARMHWPTWRLALAHTSAPQTRLVPVPCCHARRRGQPRAARLTAAGGRGARVRASSVRSDACTTPTGSTCFASACVPRLAAHPSPRASAFDRVAVRSRARPPPPCHVEVSW